MVPGRLSYGTVNFITHNNFTQKHLQKFNVKVHFAEYFGFKVLRTMIMDSTTGWDVTQWSLVEVH
jgi:hypothetical protein